MFCIFACCVYPPSTHWRVCVRVNEPLSSSPHPLPWNDTRTDKHIGVNFWAVVVFKTVFCLLLWCICHFLKFWVILLYLHAFYMFSVSFFLHLHCSCHSWLSSVAPHLLLLQHMNSSLALLCTPDLLLAPLPLLLLTCLTNGGEETVHMPLIFRSPQDNRLSDVVWQLSGSVCFTAHSSSSMINHKNRERMAITTN